MLFKGLYNSVPAALSDSDFEGKDEERFSKSMEKAFVAMDKVRSHDKIK